MRGIDVHARIAFGFGIRPVGSIYLRQSFSISVSHVVYKQEVYLFENPCTGNVDVRNVAKFFLRDGDEVLKVCPDGDITSGKDDTSRCLASCSEKPFSLVGKAEIGNDDSVVSSCC